MYVLSSILNLFFHIDTLRSRCHIHISSEDRHFDSHKFMNRSDRDDSYDYSHGSPIRTAREERAPQLDRGRRSRRYSESEVSKCMTNHCDKAKNHRPYNNRTGSRLQL